MAGGVAENLMKGDKGALSASCCWIVEGVPCCGCGVMVGGLL